MMKLIILLLLGIIGVNSSSSEYTTCYKCVSNYIVYNWEHVHLKSNLLSGDDMVGDDACLNSTFSRQKVKCVGQCALFKVLAEHDEEKFTFGVYRDCASSISFKGIIEQIDESSNKLELPLKTVRGYRRKASFEVCEEDYCNSEQRSYHPKDTPSFPRKPSGNHATSTIPIYALSTLICSILVSNLNI